MEPGDITKQKVQGFLGSLNGNNGKIGDSELSINMGCNDTVCGIKGASISFCFVVKRKFQSKCAYPLM